MLPELVNGEVGFTAFIQYVVSALIVIFITMPVHEWAHGFAASKLGDPTPRYLGRLTLNPLAHIDYVGALMIFLFGFGWAKPVQVNSRYFKNPKRDMAITAFAGPLSNIIVAFFSLVIAFALLYITAWVSFSAAWLDFIFSVFLGIAQINISLAVFNLIPIPPLDGSKLLSAFLPNRIYYRLMQYERYFFIIIVLLLFTGILDYPLDFLFEYIFTGVAYLAQLPFKLIFG